MTTIKTLLSMSAIFLTTLSIAQNDTVKYPTPGSYNQIALQNNRIIIAEREGKYGVVDHHGNLLLPYVYDGTEPQFVNGYLKVYKDGNEGIINDEGKLIVEPIYQYVSTANKDFFVIKLNDKYGTINSEGKQIIPTDYAKELVFSEGMASVELNGKYGFINPKGELIIPYEYDKPAMFTNGRALVTLGEESFEIDKQNKRIYPQEEKDKPTSKPAKKTKPRKRR